MKSPSMSNLNQITVLYGIRKTNCRIRGYCMVSLLQYQTYQLEKVQRNAARFVMNDFSQFSSVTRMLEHQSWPSLEQRRTHFKLLMLLKLIYHLVEIPSITLTSLTSCTRGHNHRFTIPPIRTESYLHSFLPSAVKLWNNLPQSLIKIDNIDDFKKALEHHLYPLSPV